jgi:hypothetical protein
VTKSSVHSDSPVRHQSSRRQLPFPRHSPLHFLCGVPAANRLVVSSHSPATRPSPSGTSSPLPLAPFPLTPFPTVPAVCPLSSRPPWHRRCVPSHHDFVLATSRISAFFCIPCRTINRASSPAVAYGNPGRIFEQRCSALRYVSALQLRYDISITTRIPRTPSFLVCLIPPTYQQRQHFRTFLTETIVLTHQYERDSVR